MKRHKEPVKHCQAVPNSGPGQGHHCDREKGHLGMHRCWCGGLFWERAGVFWRIKSLIQKILRVEGGREGDGREAK